jgi:hypothetical protein
LDAAHGPDARRQREAIVFDRPVQQSEKRGGFIVSQIDLHIESALAGASAAPGEGTDQ